MEIPAGGEKERERERDEDEDEEYWIIHSKSYPPAGEFLNQFEWSKEEKVEEKGSRNSAGRKSVVQPPKNEVKKALSVLGLNLSDQKAMEQLGLDEDSLQQAKEELEKEKEESEMKVRKRLPSNRTNIKKALKVLGEDPSRKKIMDRLGVDEIELKEAEKETSLSNSGEHRLNTKVPNKKEYKKALSVLGLNPTADKLKRTYGINLEEVDPQQDVLMHSEEDQEVQASTHFKDRQSVKKALLVMGCDPSKEKLKTVLGIDHNELETAKLTLLDMHEEKFVSEESKRRFVPTKRESQKALSVLGYNQTEAKIKETLGIDEESFEEVKNEVEKNKTEAFIANQKKQIARTDRTSTRKAYSVLGFDPSVKKAAEKLGVEDDEVVEILNQGANTAEKQEIPDELLEPSNNPKMQHVPDKTVTKAMKVLGIDRQAKAAAQLGINPDELKAAESEAQSKDEKRHRGWF